MKKLGRDILIILAAVLVIRSFLYEPYRIPSSSMEPSLLVGDLIFVSKFKYGYSRFSMPLSVASFDGRIFGSLPERGDIAVFRKPTNDSESFIKRVVGLPGDKIRLISGRLYINNRLIERQQVDNYEIDIPNGTAPVPQFIETFPNKNQHKIIEIFGDRGELDSTKVYQVPEGSVFMMGDNRDNSRDSRYSGPQEVGFVPLDHLIGKAEIVALSYNFNTSPWNWLRWNRFLYNVQ